MGVGGSPDALVFLLGGDRGLVGSMVGEPLGSPQLPGFSCSGQGSEAGYYVGREILEV